MRITRELLHKFAFESVKQRNREMPDLHAAYLVGSLLTDDPLIGGTTDIDIVLVHKYQIPVERETDAINPEVCLDIFHKLRSDYDQLRQLRQDPLMGYPLTLPNILLLDTDHWLEFIQSSVSAEFHRSDNVLARVNLYASAAREHWLSLYQTPSQTQLEWIHRYLEILALAANAISGLIGPPLTTRRFLPAFEERVDELGVPKLIAGFYGLLGYSEDQETNLAGWVEALSKDMQYLTGITQPPIHLAPCRHAYYLDALQAQIEGDTPAHAIWPLLRTWVDVHLASLKPTPGIDAWESMLSSLNLTEDAAVQKTEALDSYLDNVEITIESWSKRYGF